MSEKRIKVKGGIAYTNLNYTIMTNDVQAPFKDYIDKQLRIELTGNGETRTHYADKIKNMNFNISERDLIFESVLKKIGQYGVTFENGNYVPWDLINNVFSMAPVQTEISSEQFLTWLGNTDVNKENVVKNCTEEGITVVLKEYDDKGGTNINEFFLRGKVVALKDDKTFIILLSHNNNYPQDWQEVEFSKGDLVYSQDLTRYTFGNPHLVKS